MKSFLKGCLLPWQHEPSPAIANSSGCCRAAIPALAMQIPDLSGENGERRMFASELQNLKPNHSIGETNDCGDSSHEE